MDILTQYTLLHPLPETCRAGDMFPARGRPNCDPTLGICLDAYRIVRGVVLAVKVDAVFLRPNTVTMAQC